MLTEDVKSKTDSTSTSIEENPAKDRYHIGFIAQDINDLYPELV